MASRAGRCRVDVEKVIMFEKWLMLLTNILNSDF